MSTFRAVFLGFVVAAIALVIGDARRVNSAGSVPSHSEVTYTIANGATSSVFTIPATNSPVTMNVAVYGGNARGVASVVFCSTTASPPTLVWSGHAPNVNADSGGDAFGGSTTTTLTPIAPITATANVILRVSSTALNKVEILNTSGAPVNAVLEITY